MMTLWCWNLQNMLELPFSFCISKKPGEILIFRTYMAKFWIFAYFAQNIAIFRSAMFLWRHNYVTPWLIVLILVCMSREDPYLPIDTKINFIGVRFGKSGEGVATNPPWLEVVTKNSLVRRGLRSHNWVHFDNWLYSVLFPWAQIRYLKNLKLFLIRVKELFKPIVLRKKNADGFLLFLKAFSSETDLWVTLGDFTLKIAKFGRKIFI